MVIPDMNLVENY